MTDTMPAGTAPRSRGLHALFVATLLSGSFLLFLVQPMVARMALPLLGGAPAVWNSAMLVYQALLLGGYAYAHWLGRASPRTQAAVHLGVLAVAALWLPIGIRLTRLPVGAEPVLWTPWLLGASIGPLFFAVAAQAPLMQRWYATASGGRDPYVLYAASNVGSFVGLLAFPLLVEPLLAVRAQSWAWSGGYLLLVAFVAACALQLPRRGEAAARAPLTTPAPDARRVLHWIVLALVPSGLMLATTTFLTTDIVAVPMLWVLPLGLYLLSFTVAFSTRRLASDLTCKFAPVTVLVLGGMMIAGHNANPFLNAVIALALLFVVAVALHARMYALRPAPERLTGFYLAMSVGGALGGVLTAVVAPVVFDWTYEYPLLILGAGVLMPQSFLLPAFERLWTARPARTTALIVGALVGVALLVMFGIGLETAMPAGVFGYSAELPAFLGIVLIGLFAIGMRVPYAFALAGALFVFGGYDAVQLSLSPGARVRSYFGVYTIATRSDHRELSHGTTLHGIQLLGTPERERMPTTYYVPGSGVGRAMTALPQLYGPAARVGVVGLGTGTLACYARPGQQWRFYEIDRTVVQIARDSGAFSFLSNCLPDARIVLGDARLSIAEAAPNSLDLLALDAFSSDAVPMHLMTREAFETYGRALGRRGLLLVHVSNRYLDLEPVVAATAKGWMAAILYHQPDSTADGQTGSEWIALTRDMDVLGSLVAADPGWVPVRSRPGFTPWTDDYASILPVLRGVEWP